ncbi:hypothetical protein H5410_016167 [Solanum commersonii]|uniref:Uncharacterized protein n=1 Tax=Solanum commersonii TaxID=4109 RepID=A0A9J5ZWS7_SOLCO|nr:hypothetical protein H5410_016167 [Solanum commersonii]
MISIRLSGTISTQIANEPGADYPQIARSALHVVLAVTVIKGIVLGLIILLLRALREFGWQKIGAIINFGSYYFLGIPCAVLMAFVLHIGGKGLWLGIICALLVQVLCFLFITLRTN